MLNKYALFAFAATVLVACGAPASPQHDAGGGGGDAPDAATARPCFPGEGTLCRTGAVPYCYVGTVGPAPFDNCAPSCGDGTDTASAWCCPFATDAGPIGPTCCVEDAGPCGADCVTVSECNQEICQQTSCTNGMCVMIPEPKGTACAGGHCAGAGVCQ